MPPVVENFNVEIPDRWLLDSLIKRQEDAAHDPKGVKSVWKEFSQLPNDYRHMIGRYINEKNEYERDPITWVLLHLECMLEKRRRGVFGQGTRGEVLGVYAVLKKNKKPRDRSPEYEYAGRTRPSQVIINNDNILPISRDQPRHTRRSTMDDYLTRYRPRKSPYEPQGSRVSRTSKPLQHGSAIQRQRPRPASVDIRNDNSADYYLYPESQPKSVSFAEASLKHPNALRPAPYTVFPRPSEPRFAQPFYPGVLWPSSPRRSRSRSRSPKPLRRSGTGKYTFNPLGQQLMTDNWTFTRRVLSFQ